jgi:Bacterial SH3 domain
VTQRISELRAEVEALEDSLAGAPQATEDADDGEWTIPQVRRAVIKQDLRAKKAELAQLAERAGLPEMGVPSRAPKPVRIVAEAHASAGEAAPPAKKRKPRNGAIHLVESIPAENETAAPDTMPQEGRTDSVAPALAEVAEKPELAASTKDATEAVSSETPAQVGNASGGSEPAVEPAFVANGQPEAAHGGWRRPMAVLTGGLLALVAIGALLALTGNLPEALVVPGQDPSSAGDVLAAVVPPNQERDPQPVSTAEAAMESNVEAGPQAGSDRVTGPEANAGLEATGAAVTESPRVVLAAIVDTPGFTGVNLRRGPSTSAAAIMVIPTGTRVELLDGRAEDAGTAWQQVRTPDGETGWVVSGSVQS